MKEEVIEINSQTKCLNGHILEPPLIPNFEPQLNINALIEAKHLIAQCFVCCSSKTNSNQNDIHDEGYSYNAVSITVTNKFCMCINRAVDALNIAYYLLQLFLQFSVAALKMQPLFFPVP